MTNPTPTREPLTERAQRWYDDFLAALDDLSIFERHAASHASRGGTAWFKARDSKTADLIAAMGDLAVQNNALIDVARAVIAGVNPHSSEREHAAQAYRAASAALARGFDDVAKRSGPEPYRFKDCQRAYRRDERVAILVTLGLHLDQNATSIDWRVRHFYETEKHGNGYPVRAPRSIARRLQDEAR